MREPDFQRRFDSRDFRGYFTWGNSLTKKLNHWLYHACHRDELIRILEEDCVGLRSTWSLDHPEHGLWTAPGVWCGPQLPLPRVVYRGPYDMGYGGLGYGEEAWQESYPLGTRWTLCRSRRYPGTLPYEIISTDRTNNSNALPVVCGETAG